LALKVSDLEAATRFYENVFGFRQVGTGRSRGHVLRHLTDGYVDLALMVYDSEDDEEAKLVGDGPAIHHFGIEIDDRQSFIEKIKANGSVLLSKPDAGTVKFRSPDGTIAEIVDIGRYQKMRDERSRVSAVHTAGARRAFISEARRNDASVLACKAVKSKSSTSSRTTNPSAVTSMTARSV